MSRGAEWEFFQTEVSQESPVLNDDPYCGWDLLLHFSVISMSAWAGEENNVLLITDKKATHLEEHTQMFHKRESHTHKVELGTNQGAHSLK